MSGNGTSGGSPPRPTSAHPSLEELSDALAGLPVDFPDVTHHLASCDVCSAEVRELDAITAALAALPPVRMPDDVWDRTLHRLSGARRRRRVPSWAAAAAGVAAVLVGVGMLTTLDDAGSDSDTHAASSEASDDAVGAGPAASPPTPSLGMPSRQQADTLSCGSFGIVGATAWQVVVPEGGSRQVEGPAGIIARFDAGPTAVTVTALPDVRVILTAATGGPRTVVTAGAAEALAVGYAPLDSVLVCFQR